MPESIYHLDVAQPIRLMERILVRFAGNARLSLEGDLSRGDAGGVPVLSRQPDALLPSHTLHPERDFWILPVEPDTVDAIAVKLLPRIGLRQRVWHVQMEKEGRRVFAAHDGFDRDGVWVAGQVAGEFITSLVKTGAIRGYRKSEMQRRP